MKAIVTSAFIGRRDDRGESETFKIGDEIEGELAEVAVRDGNAEIAADAEENAAEKPVAKKGRK